MHVTILILLAVVFAPMADAAEKKEKSCELKYWKKYYDKACISPGG